MCDMMCEYLLLLRNFLSGEEIDDLIYNWYLIVTVYAQFVAWQCISYAHGYIFEDLLHCRML